VQAVAVFLFQGFPGFSTMEVIDEMVPFFQWGGIVLISRIA
jgi:hypothetical protein